MAILPREAGKRRPLKFKPSSALYPPLRRTAQPAKHYLYLKNDLLARPLQQLSCNNSLGTPPVFIHQ